MAYIVVCEFDNGMRDTLRDDFSELSEAVRFALKWADHYPDKPTKKHELPTHLKVIEDGEVQLAIKIFSGGLADRTRRGQVWL